MLSGNLGSNLEDAVYGWGGGVSAAIPREASRWYGCRSQWHRSEEKCSVVDGVCVCVCVTLGYAYV